MPPAALQAAAKMPDAFYDCRLLSFRQTQEMLGVSKGALVNLLKNKQNPIPSVKINKSRKFRLDWLLTWIEAHKQ